MKVIELVILIKYIFCVLGTICGIFCQGSLQKDSPRKEKNNPKERSRLVLRYSLSGNGRGCSWEISPKR